MRLTLDPNVTTETVTLPREEHDEWLVLAAPVDFEGGTPHSWTWVRSGRTVTIPLFSHRYPAHPPSALAAAVALGAALGTALASRAAPLAIDPHGVRRLHLAWTPDAAITAGADSVPTEIDVRMGLAFQLR